MSTSSPVGLWPLAQAVKDRGPVVHNITNLVVMHTTANALLAFGASPIMAHAEEEMEEIVSIASALVVNIGTLSAPWIRSMKKAVLAAKKRQIPIVLDPVGAGASSLRTETAMDLARLAEGPVIRGNASEIMALCGVNGPSRGVDSAVTAGREAEEAAIRLARDVKGCVCVSGEKDIVTDGKTVITIQGGSALMPKVTGMGCAASALAGAVAGASPGVPSLQSLSAAMAVMSAAGTMAGKAAAGPGSFLPAFLDALYLLTGEDVAKHIRMDQHTVP